MVSPGSSFGRRPFLQTLAVAAATGALGAVARGGEPVRPFRVRRELFLKSPRAGVTMLATSFYTRREGGDLMSRHSYLTQSDTANHAFVRFSPDNGRTWSEPEEVLTAEKRPGGMFRRNASVQLVDPATGTLIGFRIEGLFADDHPLARLRGWTIHTALSDDGGRSWQDERPVIHEGAEFSAAHPLPGVWTGKNCAFIGDKTCVPIALADGTILMPIQIAPLGADGKLYNPGGGYTFTHAAVLRGRWNSRRELAWEMSPTIEVDPALSTRGMIEPTIASLADGRLLLVLRGSNDRKPAVFGARWVSFSSDQGRTWTKPAHWTYEDGTAFHSPSACSQLLAHSSGRLFWLGNLSPRNPTGNGPRYPLVIGEVNRRTGALRRETVVAIDDRGPGDSELLSLSNFHAREDRETREVVVNMARQGVNSVAGKPDFTADAFLYRITVV